MKGALISACLDLYLLKLSGNQYGFKDLKHDLGIKYGKDKFFEDDELFDEIERLTYPEIKEFLLKHVQGSEPIPYEKYFALAGVQYIPKEISKEFSLGSMAIDGDAEGKLVIVDTTGMDAFGRKMGYRKGDVIESLNGEATVVSNANQLIQKFFTTVKEGDKVTIVVKRQSNGKTESVTLSATAAKIEKTRLHQLRFDEHPAPEQLALRRKWLNTIQ